MFCWKFTHLSFFFYVVSFLEFYKGKHLFQLIFYLNLFNLFVHFFMLQNVLRCLEIITFSVVCLGVNLFEMHFSTFLSVI